MTYLVAHVGPSLLHFVHSRWGTSLSERQKPSWSFKMKIKCNISEVLMMLSSYWVVLLFCGVMHAPPVWAPFPRIAHHVVQTVAIRREGHHLVWERLSLVRQQIFVCKITTQSRKKNWRKNSSSSSSSSSSKCGQCSKTPNLANTLFVLKKMCEAAPPIESRVQLYSSGFRQNKSILPAGKN